MTWLGEEDAVGDAFRRSKRRHFWLILAITALLTWAGIAWLTAPAWRKVASRGWPETAAKIERIEKVGPESVEKLLLGSPVRLTFRYVTPDGVTRTARQEVSGAFARQHRINENGYFTIGVIGDRARLGELTCAYDPSSPGRAVVERTLSRADVLALIPILIVLFGVIVARAELRAGRSAGDGTARHA